MAEPQDTSSTTPSSSKRLIKYTAGHYKKAGISHEDFIHWFTHEHLPAAIPLFKKHNIAKYTLFVTPPEIGAAFRPELLKVYPGWEVSAFDCILEYWMYDLSVLKNLVADPDWAAKAVKDQDQWCDLSRSTVHIGFDTPFLLESGEVVNLPNLQ